MTVLVRLTRAVVAFPLLLFAAAVPRTSPPKWVVAQIPEPSSAFNGTLYGATCVAATNCLAVGTGEGTGSAIRPTGAAFSRLASVACPSPMFCVAVGYSEASPNGTKSALAETWSKKWALDTVAQPVGATAYSFTGISCRTGTSCVAVGSYTTPRGTFPLSELWNGTTWSVVTVKTATGTMAESLLGVSCLSKTTCMAVGTGVTAQGNGVTLAEELANETWSVVPSANVSGTTDDVLTGVACPSVTSCVASAYAIGSSGDIIFLEQWSSKSFALTASGTVHGDYSSGLNGVACESATFCAAAGAHPDGSGPDDGLIEQT